MLTAADPPAHALWFAHYLGHQPECVSGPCEEMPMTAMVREHMIVVGKVLDDRYRIGLLADARVSGAVKQASFEHLEQAFLEAADEAHPTVQPHRARLTGRAR